MSSRRPAPAPTCAGGVAAELSRLSIHDTAPVSLLTSGSRDSHEATQAPAGAVVTAVQLKPVSQKCHETVMEAKVVSEPEHFSESFSKHTSTPLDDCVALPKSAATDASDAATTGGRRRPRCLSSAAARAGAPLC